MVRRVVLYTDLVEKLHLQVINQKRERMMYSFLTVAMWLDAIDLLMKRMKEGGVDFTSIAAISGAGQVRLLLKYYVL